MPSCRVIYPSSQDLLLHMLWQHVTQPLLPSSYSKGISWILRAHLATLVTQDCLKTGTPAIDSKDRGWCQPKGRDVLLPTIMPPDTPMAPAELFLLIKCGCSAEKLYATKRCSCMGHGLGCTIFCHCRQGGDCHSVMYTRKLYWLESRGSHVT